MFISCIPVGRGDFLRASNQFNRKSLQNLPALTTKSLKFMLVLAVLYSSRLGANESTDPNEVGSHTLIEMAKLDSAYGVFEGAKYRYQNNIDTSKAILVIHSRATTVSEWIFWVIWDSSGLLGCIASQNSTAPSWVALSLDSKSPDALKIINEVKKIIDIIETNKQKFTNQELPDDSAGFDVCIGKKAANVFDLLEIPFPEGDLEGPHHELRRVVDELILTMVVVAKGQPEK